MKTFALKSILRSVTVGCLAAAPLLVAGRLPAQDFQYLITNGAVTITNYAGPGGNVAIPATIAGLPVTAIGGRTFLGSTTLTAITIPDTVTNIEDGVLTRAGGLGAFGQCSALTNVYLGNGVVNIGMGTFTLCTGLRRASIPDSVRTVGDFAFHNCESLTDLKIGKSVTQLGPFTGYAFDGSTNLASVEIPGNVTNIGNYAFADSPSLARVTMQKGVATIGDHAFYASPSLTNITLPRTVTAINDQALGYCMNLMGVFFAGDAPALLREGNVFSYSSNAIVYYLPGATGWGPAFAGRPTMLWNPQMQTTDGSFGVRQNQFGFNISGTPDIPLVIEASVELATPSWIGLHTCTLTNGLIYFSDPQWTNHPERFYRIRSP